MRKSAALAALFLGIASADPTQSFIRSDGGRFVTSNCTEFFVSGVNGWLVAENGPRLYLDVMEKAGLNTLRFFAHGSGEDWIIQTAPAVYNEARLRQIDRVIYEAKLRGVRVIASFANNWKSADGKKQYVAWVPGLRCNIGLCAGSPDDDAQFECEKQNCPDEDLFFTDARVKQLYKNHLRYMVNRINVYTKVAYKDEPTIFGWDLMNEPNVKSTPACWGNTDPSAGAQCAAALQAWIEDMSGYLKTVDPNHMVTIGYEGFYGPSASLPQRMSNPLPPFSRPIDATYYASQAGQNFAENHRPGSVDFAAVHFWPDNWLKPFPEFTNTYLTQRIADARAIGKPLIIEEFGKVADPNPASIAKDRDPFFKTIYDTIAQNIATDGPLKGSLFWEYGGGTDRSISERDSTWNYITADSQLIASANGPKARPVPSCIPGTRRSYQLGTVPGPKATQFACFGDNTVVAGPSTPIPGPPAMMPQDCGAACAANAACSAFTVSSGSCTLLSTTSYAVGWMPGAKTCWVVNPASTAGLGLLPPAPAAATVVAAAGP